MKRLAGQGMILYHATSPEKALKIIESGKILPWDKAGGANFPDMTEHDYIPNGIYLSTNPGDVIVTVFENAGIEMAVVFQVKVDRDNLIADPVLVDNGMLASEVLQLSKDPQKKEELLRKSLSNYPPGAAHIGEIPASQILGTNIVYHDSYSANYRFNNKDGLTLNELKRELLKEDNLSNKHITDQSVIIMELKSQMYDDNWTLYDDNWQGLMIQYEMFIDHSVNDLQKLKLSDFAAYKLVSDFNIVDLSQLDYDIYTVLGYDKWDSKPLELDEQILNICEQIYKAIRNSIFRIVSKKVEKDRIEIIVQLNTPINIPQQTIKTDFKRLKR